MRNSNDVLNREITEKIRSEIHSILFFKVFSTTAVHAPEYGKIERTTGSIMSATWVGEQLLLVVKYITYYLC